MVPIEVWHCPIVDVAEEYLFQAIHFIDVQDSSFICPEARWWLTQALQALRMMRKGIRMPIENHQKLRDEWELKEAALNKEDPAKLAARGIFLP